MALTVHITNLEKIQEISPEQPWMAFEDEELLDYLYPFLAALKINFGKEIDPYGSVILKTPTEIEFLDGLIAEAQKSLEAKPHQFEKIDRDQSIQFLKNLRLFFRRALHEKKSLFFIGD